MQRLLGCLFIITATTGAGILYGLEQQNYLEKLLYVRHMIYMLKGELEYSNAPLGEIFGRLSARVKEPYRTWFRKMERKIEEREADGFLKIWTASIDQDLQELHLKSAHSLQLKELGIYLGQTDSETESRTLKLYLDRLEMEIEKVREGLSSRKRLGKCLGVMSGIFLVIVLI